MKTLREISTEKILVAAHRGASTTAPENTLAAFNEAIKVGADMIELDVQFSKDGKLLVYHDNILKNKNVRISHLDFLDLQQYEKEKKLEEKILLLEQVFEIAKDKVYLVIEIKPEFSDSNKVNLLRLIELIKQHNLLKYIVVISFDIENLKFIRQQNKTLITAAIYSSHSKLLPSDYKLQTACEAFICSIDELNENISANAKENNILMGVYGVNDAENLQKALKHKVLVVGSDNCEKIIELMRNM